MSDKVFQLFERALRNLKNNVSGALARRNEPPLRVPQTPLTFHPLAHRKAFRRRDTRQQSRLFVREERNVDGKCRSRFDRPHENKNDWIDFSALLFWKRMVFR